MKVADRDEQRDVVSSAEGLVSSAEGLVSSAEVSSLVVARLIQEVTDGVETHATAYNRTYNRHNR
jgi:hypothetical protein